jgi:hypothetical protein
VRTQVDERIWTFEQELRQDSVCASSIPLACAASVVMSIPWDSGTAAVLLLLLIMVMMTMMMMSP